MGTTEGFQAAYNFTSQKMRCNQEKKEEEEKMNVGVSTLLLLDNIGRQREAAHDSNKYYFPPLLAPLKLSSLAYHQA